MRQLRLFWDARCDFDGRQVSGQSKRLHPLVSRTDQGQSVVYCPHESHADFFTHIFVAEFQVIKFQVCSVLPDHLTFGFQIAIFSGPVNIVPNSQAIGHIRDIRRLVVAMSRARLGLYVFCRQVFASSYMLGNNTAHRPNKHLFVYRVCLKIATSLRGHSRFFRSDRPSYRSNKMACDEFSTRVKLLVRSCFCFYVCHFLGRSLSDSSPGGRQVIKSLRRAERYPHGCDCPPDDGCVSEDILG